MLLEEDLHVASRLGMGSMVLDVSAYVFCLTKDPMILYLYASLQYNPDLFLPSLHNRNPNLSLGSTLDSPRPSMPNNKDNNPIEISPLNKGSMHAYPG